jgi:AraC-like DNA-binding protein
MERLFKQAILMETTFTYIGQRQAVHYPALQARTLVRCCNGEGKAEINDETFPLHRNMCLLATWNANAKFRAFPDHPVLLHFCHIIPDYDSNGQAPDFAVATTKEEQNEKTDSRNDIDIPEMREVIYGFEPMAHPLRHLTNYAFMWFRDHEHTEMRARQLGQMLLSETVFWARDRHTRGLFSHFIQQASDYMHENYHRPISTSDLANHLHCSRSTVTRHFRNELNKTPTYFINHFKIQRAEDLLNNTQLHIGEVAHMVGINDHYYFSKLFKKHTGISPSTYRARREKEE